MSLHCTMPFIRYGLQVPWNLQVTRGNLIVEKAAFSCLNFAFSNCARFHPVLPSP